MSDHARTHIKAMIDSLKEQEPEKLAQPAGVFISGMLTGLAASAQILGGSTAEAEMERTEVHLAAAIGNAYLNGTLPPPAAASASEAGEPPSWEDAVRGVQGWMALDVHRALGLPVDEQAEHQGYRSWSDWWATLCSHISQRTLATRRHLEDLAVPDSLTFHNARQWAVDVDLARPESMFFPVRYGAVLAEAHPTTPNDPSYMVDLSGYEDGDPIQERVLRLIIHRSLAARLARDLTALETTPTDEPASPALGRLDAAALGDLVDTAKEQMVAELGEGERDAAPLEAIAYHAAGLSYSLEKTEAERDGAYRERAYLVALLAAMTDGAVIAPAPDLEEPGWQIVYLTIGGRQASWHISPDDAALFACVPHVDPDHPHAQWDGHTTEDKYAHIREHTRALFHQCGPACAEGHTYTGRCEGALPRPVDDSTTTAPAVVHPDITPHFSSPQRVDEPCVQHPTAPVIGGMCGGCTQYPADMTRTPATTEQPDAQH